MLRAKQMATIDKINSENPAVDATGNRKYGRIIGPATGTLAQNCTLVRSYRMLAHPVRPLLPLAAIDSVGALPMQLN
ncbi:hypothetical protein BW21_6206 (plasmid) [Burkholderia humptydooensis]|nr:hypothetical protein BW21_6206 [Burkholderia sp. 2002721687]